MSTVKEGRGCTPEELVPVFHELRVDEVHCAGAYAHALQISGKYGEKGMVGVEFDLAGTIDDEIVVIVPSELFLEPVHVL